MADIRVKLKNANGDILHPQTEWNLILNKPSLYTHYCQILAKDNSCNVFVWVNNTRLKAYTTFYALCADLKGYTLYPAQGMIKVGDIKSVVIGILSPNDDGFFPVVYTWNTDVFKDSLLDNIDLGNTNLFTFHDTVLSSNL